MDDREDPDDLKNDEQLARLIAFHNTHTPREDEPMTFAQSIILLIAIGVLLYLIYALIWPERF